ncbi:hypothetical protein TNCV_321471 [Trichonephila clavipes]|nr:hypothetical protein TNCV_321471 [Trichonephila clavipes]
MVRRKNLCRGEIANLLRKLFENESDGEMAQNGYRIMVMMFLWTDGLFIGLLCKAVYTFATYVFTVDALSDTPVSRNRYTKSVIVNAFGAVSPGYFY